MAHPPRRITAFIAAGSNEGNRQAQLDRARGELIRMDGIVSLKSSKVYETEPVGGPPQGKYLNAVWKIETEFTPELLLERLLAIEAGMGRIRTVKNGPRMIDLDLIAYGDEIIRRPGLEIPHPRMHERFFVLKPLNDLAPEWKHPGLRKTVRELLESCDEAN